MYRQIVTPENTKLILQIPSEFVGKQVEVIAFTLNEMQSVTNQQAEMEESEKFYRSINIDMSKFKFDREKSHER